MKTYKTIKELPNIPVGTEFAYEESDTAIYKYKTPIGKFIDTFGIDCGFFEEVIPKSHKRFRAEKGGSYFYIDSVGRIQYSYDNEDKFDVYHYNYNSGNYYRTAEEATFARDRQLFITKVNDRIMELNEGWVFEDFGDYAEYIVRQPDGLSFVCTDVIHTSVFVKIKPSVGSKILKEFHEDISKFIFN